jgi:hypothetical protein
MEGMEKGSIKKSKYAPAGTGENAEVLRISIFPTADSALQEEGKSVPARPQIQQDVLPAMVFWGCELLSCHLLPHV